MKNTNTNKVTLKAQRNDPRYIKMSFRNKKLIPNEKNNWLIWNLPAVKTCPFATEMCKALCYAVKSERAYPNVIKSRLRNLEVSQNDDFVARMIYTINVELSRAKKAGKKLNIRIHESGDFYNQEYVNKWVQIAENFKYDNSVVFWVYTKSVSFFNEYTAQLLNIRGSVWADTKPDQLTIMEKLNIPIYTADTIENITARKKGGEKIHICRCSDCANCRACPNCKVKKIICEIH